MEPEKIKFIRRLPPTVEEENFTANEYMPTSGRIVIEYLTLKKIKERYLIK